MTALGKHPDRPLMAIHVAEAVGATKRQVQLWTDAGVLRPLSGTDRQGRGRQRLYPRSELPLAAFASFLSRYQIPIGRLLNYVNWLRISPELETEWLCSVDTFIIIEPVGEPDYMWFGTAEALTPRLSEMPGAIVVNVRKVVAPFTRPTLARGKDGQVAAA